MRQRLIFIGGSPWVGKTACAQELFKLLEDSAWLDGDDVWRVNPFSIEDPRLRNGDVNIAHVLQTYLESDFRYIILSSVVITIPEIRKRILGMVKMKDYDLSIFILRCDRETLQKRCSSRNQSDIISYRWQEMELNEGETAIDTTDRDSKEIAREIYEIVTT